MTPRAVASPTPLPTPPRLPVLEAYEDRRDPVSLLVAYVNAINCQEYERAWGYRENPPNPPYDNLRRGFADTASVFLVIGPPIWIGAAAGSMYSTIPTLLAATHTDGSQHIYVGCYVAHAIDPGMLPTPTPEEEWSL